MSKSLAVPLHSLGLAEMSPEQLGATYAKLDEARVRYDGLAGICATLQGFVLLEVKRQVGHGNYVPWLKNHFPKSEDTARQCVRFAEHFAERLEIKNTPESKYRARSVFDAQQLLLVDLADQLSAERAEPLDLENPFVQAVSAYVAGRSMRQMLLELGPALRGGRREKTSPELTPKERHDREVAALRKNFELRIFGIQCLVEDATWGVMADIEIECAIDFAEAFIGAARAYLKTPKAQRAARALEDREAA